LPGKVFFIGGFGYFLAETQPLQGGVELTAVIGQLLPGTAHVLFLVFPDHFRSQPGGHPLGRVQVKLLQPVARQRRIHRRLPIGPGIPPAIDGRHQQRVIVFIAQGLDAPLQFSLCFLAVLDPEID
jgi:hypothetical protein